jgi:Ricin-type beta-trefoil lectin domain-like
VSSSAARTRTRTGRGLRTGAVVIAVAAILAAIAVPAAAEPQNVYRVRQNLHSGKCLGVPSGNMTNGTGIIQWQCLDAAIDQGWRRVYDTIFIETPAGPRFYDGYRFRNRVNDNKCLAVPNSSPYAGTQLVIWDCIDKPDQLWAVSDLFAACHDVRNQATGMYMGLQNSSRLDGTPVIQWPYDRYNDNQVWCWSN